MSKLKLIGTGAAYFRVSGEKQEVQRQLVSVAGFEDREGVTIPAHHRYEDHMPRDLSAKRPDFQRMMKGVKSGAIKWIVVDQIDRFGFADEWELVEMIGDLRKAGCRLFDAGGDEWTAQGLLSFFKAGLAGYSSRDEQVKKSSRVLGGMVAKAKAGEWQGAPPKLGFDVACFDRASGAELWRVIWEGREDTGRKEKRNGVERPVYNIHRLKVYPDGRTERLDGTAGNVTFRTSKDTQRMQIVPTKDEAKRAAARGLFTRYATEAVTFFDLAKWLNGLGVRNSFGKLFQSNDVRKLLGDEAYLGYTTFSKRRNGRFHRHDADGAGGIITELEEGLRGKDTESDPDDVVKSGRLFDPIIERETWDDVQKKLRGRDRKTHAPKTPALYLAGLVVCSGCGKPMIGRKDRGEYYCGTWDKSRTRGDLANSTCERNGVRHATLEGFIGKYLTDAGERLDILTGRAQNADTLTGELARQETDAWKKFSDGIVRLEEYLAAHHPEEYAALMREESERRDGMDRATEGAKPLPTGTLAGRLGEKGRRAHEAAKWGGAPLPVGDYASSLIDAYARHFNPAGVKEEAERLEAEHTAMMKAWADLPTPRAKEKAKAQLAELEGRIAELEAQQQDSGEVVAGFHRQINDLRAAIADATRCMRGDDGASALRQRAESLRGLLVRIECGFVITGRTTTGGGGKIGNARSRLAHVTFHPIAGDTVSLEASDTMGGDQHRASRGTRMGTTHGNLGSSCGTSAWTR